MKDMNRTYNFVSQIFFFGFLLWGGNDSLDDFQWSNGAQSTSRCRLISTYLRSVGYSSTVTTSREFQAEMVNPLYRHSMPIIMDSLVPNQRKKQLIPESTIETPANVANKRWGVSHHLSRARTPGSPRSHSKTESQEESAAWVQKAQLQGYLSVYKLYFSTTF